MMFKRLSPLLLVFMLGHGRSTTALPIMPPIIVTAYWPAERGAQRDSLVTLEARRQDVPHRIALAVAWAENTRGDSLAVSSAGAVGLMQIHPPNFGRFPECGVDKMVTRRQNVCYGITILRGYYESTGSWGEALRRYLGHRNNDAALIAYLQEIVDHMAREEMGQ